MKLTMIDEAKMATNNSMSLCCKIARTHKVNLLTKTIWFPSWTCCHKSHPLSVRVIIFTSICTFKQTDGGTVRGFANIKSNPNMSIPDKKCPPVHTYQLNQFFGTHHSPLIGLFETSTCFLKWKAFCLDHFMIQTTIAYLRLMTALSFSIKPLMQKFTRHYSDHRRVGRPT